MATETSSTKINGHVGDSCGLIVSGSTGEVFTYLDDFKVKKT